MLKNDFRYIVKRIILALALAFIFFFLRTNHILAATCTPTASTYDARYSYDYTTNASFTNVSFTGWGSFVGTVNMGTAIQQPSGTNGYGGPKVMTMLSLKHYISGGFVSGNTYNMIVRVNTSSSDVAAYYKTYSEIAYVRGGTTTSNLTDSNISSYTLDRIKIDNDDPKVFYIYYSFTPSANVNYVWTYVAMVEFDHTYRDIANVYNGNVVVRQNSCTYSEGANAYIQQTTNKIIEQTKQIVKIFNLDKEQLDYLKDNSDASVDVSGMTGITGLLPAGPIDSLLSIPITILNILIDSTSGTCQPLTFNFVFNQPFTLPCFDVIWDEVPSNLLIFMSDLPAVLLFILWAKSVYKRVERAISFESSVDDEWGGV